MQTWHKPIKIVSWTFVKLSNTLHVAVMSQYLTKDLVTHSCYCPPPCSTYWQLSPGEQTALFCHIALLKPAQMWSAACSLLALPALINSSLQYWVDRKVDELNASETQKQCSQSIS